MLELGTMVVALPSGKGRQDKATRQAADEEDDDGEEEAKPRRDQQECKVS